MGDKRGRDDTAPDKSYKSYRSPIGLIGRVAGRLRRAQATQAMLIFRASRTDSTTENNRYRLESKRILSRAALIREAAVSRFRHSRGIAWMPR
jgi:hypothetical protein